MDSVVLRDHHAGEGGTRTDHVMVNQIGAEDPEYSDRTVIKVVTLTEFRTDLTSNWRTTEVARPTPPGDKVRIAKTPSIKDSIIITSEQAPVHQQTTTSTDS